MDAFVFPGQGSQFRGMGRGLFEEFPAITKTASDVLGYSIEAMCLQDVDGRLSNTEYAQPALFVVNILHYLKVMRDGAKRPDWVAGHSLGEYCALFVAGAFDFATGLRLVQRRGQIMGRASGGGMAAILNMPPTAVEAAIRDQPESSLDVANYNSPSQTVVAGALDELDELRPVVQAAGATYFPLNVKAAFHSRHMRAAAEEFEAMLIDQDMGSLEIPVVSNVHARPYQASDTRDNLVSQIHQPVRWTESIWYLMAHGVSQIREIAPRPVLTKPITETVAAGVPRSFPSI